MKIENNGYILDRLQNKYQFCLLVFFFGEETKFKNKNQFLKILVSIIWIIF